MRFGASAAVGAGGGVALPGHPAAAGRQATKSKTRLGMSVPPGDSTHRNSFTV